MVKCRAISSSDLDVVSEWNRRLQLDEGASPMEHPAILDRLQRWLDADYEGLLFEVAASPVGYALFRPTDPDLKGPGGIYLRQFFIVPEHRRRGIGTEAFKLFLKTHVGHRRLVLEALASNPGGQMFWQSLGLAVYSTTLELAGGG